MKPAGTATVAPLLNPIYRQQQYSNDRYSSVAAYATPICETHPLQLGMTRDVIWVGQHASGKMSKTAPKLLYALYLRDVAVTLQKPGQL